MQKSPRGKAAVAARVKGALTHLSALGSSGWLENHTRGPESDSARTGWRRPVRPSLAFFEQPLPLAPDLAPDKPHIKFRYEPPIFCQSFAADSHGPDFWRFSGRE